MFPNISESLRSESKSAGAKFNTHRSSIKTFLLSFLAVLQSLFKSVQDVLLCYVYSHRNLMYLHTNVRVGRSGFLFVFMTEIS